PDCEDSTDVVSYDILYTPVYGGELQVIATHEYPWSSFSHGELTETMAGCYAIAATDSFMNVSVSDTFCIDDCSNYELPNVFTPGGDTYNDHFKPFPYAFVESIDLKIYNRWGLKVFETEDPDIMWDGVNQTTNRECTDGVYYYVCTVNEIRLQGVIPRDLHGFIHLLRNSQPGPN
ncbi:MAG: gliding motility-associated C-terminal domain-containing protein, partial [Flavobacteriales bacterium]|nr:gliding motility-associated C-terminal domain-containing protein [Flavobacteriales bacterium]